MDENVKNRLRLWLRSERAMGLPSVGPIADDGELSSPAPMPDSAAVAEDRGESRPVAAPPRAAVGVRATSRAVAAPPPAFVTAPAMESFSGTDLDADEKRRRLDAMDADEVRGCIKCHLCESRSHTVFGEGDADAKLMFIGEGPGFKEDQTGRPFVGPAGELLNRMIGAMGLAREQVFIANILKCRAFVPGPPAKDRAPTPEEVAACSPYLERQVEIIRPRVIVTLGLPASQYVLQSKLSMSRMRGQWQAWRGIKVMPTWHPAYILRREKEGDVEAKRQVWGDLQQVMAELGLERPKKA
ncbi:MAG: uracil-DNA glycosylase [Phycisphaerales bacterium]|jgi:uracil-DNA glycosylase family 4|nr:uracil-DNA glycosylase [Phycisphaerales bacterium]